LKEGFENLPKGCFIQLEKKASEYVFENIRSAFGQLTGLITKLAAFREDAGERPVRHTGSRPMSIMWKLLQPILAKFLKKTNKLVVG